VEGAAELFFAVGGEGAVGDAEAGAGGDAIGVVAAGATTFFEDGPDVAREGQISGRGAGGG
jgi:hypothetical protein